MRTATLKDVATCAGVSYQTVSRVINGDPRVRDSTRAAVQAAVEQLAYEPSAAARALVTGRTRTLGVVVEDLGQYGPTGILAGLEVATSRAGWDLALAAVTAHETDAVPAAVGSLKRRGVRAVVLVCGSEAVVRATLAQRVDVPMIGTTQAVDTVLPRSVEIDQRAGVRLIVDHLVATGRRRIAQLSGPVDSLDARVRTEEFALALASHGLEPAGTRHGDWSAASGAAAARALPADLRPDALFAANDQMALGALFALRADGLRVPDDVAVAGFDDIPEAAFFEPPLTTVRQDFVALGRRLFQVLDQTPDDGEAAPRPFTIEPELLIRESTVPAG